MVSATDGWAVGDRGTIAHYNGDTWEKVDSPTNTWLHKVFMVSTSDGWAVGDQGTILHYQNGVWSIYEG
jgi:photosystem II stability/assembly factor-like uncharacterized protein